MKILTDKRYWDDTYSRRRSGSTIALHWLYDHSALAVLQKVIDIGVNGKRVLEIGAGNSPWLPPLARRFPTSHFYGLDYSEAGCELLKQRSRAAGVEISVVHQDMFNENSSLHGGFDVVLSFGVAEHFDELGTALSAMSRFLHADGMMFTVIPNMAGAIGNAARLLNRPVYDLHNPHDLSSFLSGHHDAGLDVLEGGYLESTDFSVLSSCVKEGWSIGKVVYRAMCSVSVGAWLIERVVGRLPTSRMFSPFIYATSRRRFGLST